MSNVISTTKKMLVCPSCKNDIYGRLTFEMHLDERAGIVNGTATANLEIKGVQIQHDCIPKVTR